MPVRRYRISFLGRKMRSDSMEKHIGWLIPQKQRSLRFKIFVKQAHTEGEDVYCLFINASTKNGARRTLHDSQASCVSADGIEWRKLDEGLKVTGKIDKAATVLVFDRLRDTYRSASNRSLELFRDQWRSDEISARRFNCMLSKKSFYRHEITSKNYSRMGKAQSTLCCLC